MVEIECRKVKFYSLQDEASFFSWAQSITAVSNIIGQGSSIIIRIKTKRISDNSLRKLLALFQRYNIPMADLAQFRNTHNELWFASPVAYWYKSVFGDT
ncbi:MAG TPA: hypothetical protein VF543_19170 [Pyrinomonadaceae bacterium]|jgi:hypothetical protein